MPNRHDNWLWMPKIRSTDIRFFCEYELHTHTMFQLTPMTQN